MEPTSHGLPTDVCMVVVIMVVGEGEESLYPNIEEPIKFRDFVDLYPR